VGFGSKFLAGYKAGLPNNIHCVCPPPYQACFMFVAIFVLTADWLFVFQAVNALSKKRHAPRSWRNMIILYCLLYWRLCADNIDTKNTSVHFLSVLKK